MWSQIQNTFADWNMLDTWITVTAMFAAMACALPGCFLVLRKQSLMGDAISHTTLLGIGGMFLLAQAGRQAGWLSPSNYDEWLHFALLVGAVIVGVITAFLAETIQKLGRVESNAALGVVFTSLFALGLLLVRVAADDVHIDPDCVFYGNIENIVWDTWSGTNIPKATVINGTMFALNLALIALLFKELKISAFDPSLSSSLGINAGMLHYVLMGMTAATLVAAFESVGSILVISMLIVPATTALLLTRQLKKVIWLAISLAALSAIVGHCLALVVPPVVARIGGWPSLKSTSSAGMMAVTSGMFYLIAVVAGPRNGIVSKAWNRVQLTLRIVQEDILGEVYRIEEKGEVPTRDQLFSRDHTSGLMGANSRLFRHVTTYWALRQLIRAKMVQCEAESVRMTEKGREWAISLVRSHRLWESYMAKHFEVPDSHMHETAAQVEHYLDPELQEELTRELESPDLDPQGKSIP